jgi:hypothetical protein
MYIRKIDSYLNLTYNIYVVLIATTLCKINEI